MTKNYHLCLAELTDRTLQTLRINCIFKLDYKSSLELCFSLSTLEEGVCRAFSTHQLCVSDISHQPMDWCPSPFSAEDCADLPGNLWLSVSCEKMQSHYLGSCLIHPPGSAAPSLSVGLHPGIPPGCESSFNSVCYQEWVGAELWLWVSFKVAFTLWQLVSWVGWREDNMTPCSGEHSSVNSRQLSRLFGANESGLISCNKDCIHAQ